MFDVSETTTPPEDLDDANPGTTYKTTKFCLIPTYNHCS